MNKTRSTLILLLLSIFSIGVSVAQEISIANISRAKGPFDSKIEISGSGFNSSASNMEVWFGASRGIVESSSENLLIAVVPLGATTASVTVRNKTNGLAASSSKIFFPIFSGDASHDFSVTDPYNFPNTKDLFDLQMVDLDLDGKNDIVSTKKDNTATTIQVYRNTSTISAISFAEQTVSLGVPSLKLAFGDVDGDGKQDIIVTRENYFTFYVLRNTSTVGSISFAAAKQYSLRTTQFIRAAVVRDLDLDGKPEVIISNTKDDEVSIFKNTSTSGNIQLSLTPVRISTGGNRAYELIAEDFNNDGKADIAVIQSDVDVYILPNNSSTGSLQFGTPLSFPVTGTLNSIEAGDVNEDGKPDLVFVDFFSNKVGLLINESTVDNISFGAVLLENVESGSQDLTLADYTGNGKLDIIITSLSTDNLTLYKNEFSGGSGGLTKLVIPQPVRSFNIVSGDLSNDGKPDIAIIGSDASSTNFSLTVLRNNICIDPEILGDPAPTICNGQTYAFTTTSVPAATFIWKKDNIEVKNSADPFYDATVAGSYTVTAVTDGGACTVESSAINLTVNTGAIPSNPVASNNGPACLGGSVTLQSTTVTGVDSYLWSGPNGFTSTDQNPVLTNITAEMAGVYSVKVLKAPCESEISTTAVEVINPPDLTVSKTISGKVCEGETNTLTVGLATGYSYQWYKDNVLISGATSNAYNTTAAGSYTVNLTGNSNNCDLTSDPVVIETFLPPSPIFTSSGSLCEGSEITFTDNTLTETGKTATYSWDFGDGNTSSVQNPAHTYAATASPSTYIVQLTVGYIGHTCSGSVSNNIIIEQPTPFTIEVTGAIPFCEGDSVQLAVPATGFTAASWSTGEQSLSIYAKSAGNISVSATNNSGCLSTDNIDLTILAAPVINVIADSETILLGESTQLTASGADSYQWSPTETLDNPDSPTPIATPTITTTYTVNGTAANSCIGSADITITIEDIGDKLPLTIPVMFSPNNDGIDDLWVIENIQNFPDCELTIFARNGQLVFESRGYNNDWNGRDANNADLLEGAYFFTIVCPDGKNASGSISIIR